LFACCNAAALFPAAAMLAVGTGVIIAALLIDSLYYRRDYTSLILLNLLILKVVRVACNRSYVG
jgi:hypothetical protein